MKLKIIIMSALTLLAATAAVLHWWLKPSDSRGELPTMDVLADRTNLWLNDGRLCLSGQTNPFTGIMIEHTADGLLRSRSAIANGLLHGLSLGWHTNGQLQVSEYFKEGISDGVRTKWYASGAKLSEGEIVAGKFHGTFRRWSERGVLLDQVEFVAGQPDGVALAYFPDGKLKARMVMRDGQPLETTFQKISAPEP